MSNQTLIATELSRLDEIAGETALTVREAEIVSEVEPSSQDLALLGETRLQQADPYYGAGDLGLTKAQQMALAEPIPDSEIEILPTGEVYLPQVGYRRRLNAALGIGNWSLRPIDPQFARVGKTVSRAYALYVYGKFVSEAIGEADYYENARTSWATACESAKSNALMRCCKDIGIALQCWDKRYAESWKKKYAHRPGDKWEKKRIENDGGGASPSSRTTDREKSGKTPEAPTHTPPSPPPSDVKATKTATITIAEWGATFKSPYGPAQRITDADGKRWSICGSDAISAAERLEGQLQVEYETNVKDGKTYKNIVRVVGAE